MNGTVIPNTAELIAFCQDKLSTIKCPKTVDFRKQLPRAATGKLYKRRLRDEYWQRAKNKSQSS